VRVLLTGLLAGAAAFIAVALLTAGDDEAAPARAAAPPSGAAAFARMGCGRCHKLAAAGADGHFAPSLDDRLPDHTRASLRAAILHPPTGSMMPENFGERMNDPELDRLVSFLLSASRR
jgi:mono/diheme cytochrome c family protein